MPKFTYIVMSYDPAFTERNFDKRKQENDPTACSVWGIFMQPRKRKAPLPNVILLDCWEDWLGFPNLIRRIKKEMKYTYGDTDEPLLRPVVVQKARRVKHQGRRPDIILIEEKASGISLRQQLLEENILTHGYNPGNEDKLTRLHYVSPMFAAGRIWAVESEINPGNFKTWADPLISQVCSYVGPGSIERDDLLDSATQGLRLLMDKFFGPFTVVDTTEDRERARAREIAERRLAKKENPYG
jgi:phage terminase large subunit-like protein